MAVSNVFLQSETGGDNRDFVFTYTQEYKVTHNSTDSTRDILNDPQLPQQWEAHSSDPTAFVSTRSLNRNISDGRVVSTATINYTSELPREEEPENPLSRPARISWGTQNERVPVLFDKDDNPIINSAGDLLLGVEEDRALWQINVKKNVAGVPTWVTSYQNAVNSDLVVIGGAPLAVGTLKMDAIQISELMKENGTLFYEITFQILYRQEGWDQRLLNVGLREIIELFDPETGASYNELRPILTAAGEQIDEPVFLDSDGKAIRDTSIDPNLGIAGRGPLKTNLSASEIIIKTYSTKQTQPFSALPLT